MGETALVTGAARGIGKEVARQLVQRGLRVFVTARDAAAAQTAADEVGGLALALDVTVPEQVERAVATVREAGGLDVLVNNAAAFADWRATGLGTDLAEVETVWETNVLGPWRMVQAFAPLLERAAAPRVVMVTSASGSHGASDFGLANPGMVPYAVTKAAANALTRKLAAELPFARVNAVDPGLTATAPGMEAMGARPVPDGAASVVWATSVPPDGPTGGFFRDGQALPW